jgi:hypothetical protein
MMIGYLAAIGTAGRAVRLADEDILIGNAEPERAAFQARESGHNNQVASNVGNLGLERRPAAASLCLHVIVGDGDH